MSATLEALQQAVVDGDVDGIAAMTQQLIDADVAPKAILEQGLLAGMDIVGQRFKAYEMYLPEVILSANAMKAGMEVVKPLLAQGEAANTGKVVIATIEGDLHDVGKNLVSMMLEGAGFQVTDLGIDVPVAKIVEAAREKQADVVALSALLTTTMLGLEGAIKEIKAVDGSVKVIVGGAPITQAFAEKIGADGFAPDALRAIDLVKRMIA